MNTIISKFNKKCYFNLIRKLTFYDSVVINNFDLKNNQNILLTNLKIINNESLLLNSCLNFLKNFESFSVICCGCNDPKSKVQLKKSIWFSSIGLEMKDFVKYYNENEELKTDKIKILEEIVKLECPVILKDKNTILIESEIAPKKIVNSAKRMRYLFNISEIHKFSGEPDFSDFTRLMIGFYNICKIYIKRNETDRKELKHIVEKVNYFHFVLFYIYNYLLKYKHFNYNNVEEGNRNSILKYLKEKRRNMFLVKNQLLQEKVLNIPKEYSNSIIPTIKAKMKRKQKNIFEKIQKFRKKSNVLEDEEKFMWVEEKDDDFDENNINHYKTYDDNNNNNDIICNENNYNLSNNDDNSMIEIKNNCENYPLLRFQYVLKKEEDYESNEILNYNKIYNKYTKLLEKKVCINLDDQNINEDIIKSENVLFKIPEVIGGYTFINYIEHIPNNYIFPINENLYKGIHVYKKEEINIDSLWKNIENETLKIRKIGFFNPFNIKKNLDDLQLRKNKNDNSNLEKDYEEITDLKDDMTSFQEYIYNKYGEKRKQAKRNKCKELDRISYNAPVNESNDDEDERFEYFKKLKNEKLKIDDNIELKEQINSVYDDTYNEKEESNQNYKHTYNIRRKLNDEKKELGTVILSDIKEEKRNLIEDDQKELKENSFYICKNVKFPELKKDDQFRTKNRNKFLNNELQKYMRPQTHKKNSNIHGLKSKTIESHSSEKGSKSLKIFLKKEKKKHSKKNEDLCKDNI
ncbi:conserved Plasmodium protein, unknown function [Plasmodium gallinaceum]|uniref:Uncharacterized protein n=1 Tax=Plasmodium gallinaceum TaxID=5849 RepID=A0A1J1GMG5_PLAGA|nr:conserved Plasmodium protein, unknown function [Plasmodium gallinaceum]CRG93593.1 conserved Plasmodium protein, unknown function [Plasmodium gallinaceum]